MKITEANLAEAGWNRFEWNGGIIPEYWKCYYQHDYYSDFEHRIGIRFNERKGVPFTVYIFTPRGILPLRKIDTMETLELLREILSGERR